MNGTEAPKIAVGAGDALVVVDMQNDFLPGGALGVPHGDEIIPVLNDYIEFFQAKRLPVFATRDWHPPNHCSFKEQGGPWPLHCVIDSDGAAFAPALGLPEDTIVISKGSAPDREAYSGFEGTALAKQLLEAKAQRLFIGGLATDYCVLNTVNDALQHLFRVYLLLDAIRPVDVKPGDGERAETEMKKLGAVPVVRQDLE